MAAGLGWAGPGSGGEGVKVVINKQRRGAHVDVSTKVRESYLKNLSRQYCKWSPPKI